MPTIGGYASAFLAALVSFAIAMLFFLGIIAYNRWKHIYGKKW